LNSAFSAFPKKWIASIIKRYTQIELRIMLKYPWKNAAIIVTLFKRFSDRNIIGTAGRQCRRAD